MKKNVAGQTVGAQLVSKTDGSAVTTGATEVYITGDAGTQAASSGSPSGAVHEGQGYWSFPPTQAETNYDHVAFTFVNSSAVNVTVQIYTSFPQTGDNFARLGAPAGASQAADIAAIKSGQDLVKANTDKLGDTFVADGSPGNYRFSTNALSGVWDSQRGGHVLTGSFGEGVALDMTQVLPTAPTVNSTGEALFLADIMGGRFGTAQAGGASSITLDAGASATDGRYVGYGCFLYGGTGGGVRGVGQERTIVAYNGTTKVATLAQAWGTAPDNTSKFMLITNPFANVGIWNGTVVATPATAGIPDVNVKNWNNLPTVALPPTAGDVAGVKANTDKLGDTLVADGSPGNYRFSTNALSGVWDSQRGGHALTGSFGEGVTSVQGNVTGSVASVVGAVGSVTGLTALDVGAIKVVTDKVNSTLVSVGSPNDYIFTAPALSLAPTGGTAPTAVAIADEVQTRTIAAVMLVGTTINLTNAATSGDLTATMKTSVTTAATAATPIAASVAGNVAGNVVGSVGSVVGFTASNVGAIKIVTDKLNTTMESVGSPGDYVFTTTALAQAPAAPTAATIANAVLRVALTQGYAAQGAQFTLEQFCYMIHAIVFEPSIVSTTLTAGQLDHSPAMTFTLDSATTPTAQERTT